MYEIKRGTKNHNLIFDIIINKLNKDMRSMPIYNENNIYFL